ncbi:putative reverse transcriptase domain-containing protein, partial [Tanacetum coccineum]
SDYPKLKNQARGNQEGNGEARGRAYVLGGGEEKPIRTQMSLCTEYHTVIVCDEKIVHIPYGNEVLMIQDDRSEGGRNYKITKKKIVDKSGEKRLEDMPIVRDFSEVFLEDLPGLPPAQQVEFQIDFVPGVAPVAHDILIYSRNEKQHEEHLKLILELLKKEGLHAKFSKCEFWLSRVRFLGHVIDSEGIHVDPAKNESIKDWASPKTLT